MQSFSIVVEPPNQRLKYAELFTTMTLPLFGRLTIRSLEVPLDGYRKRMQSSTIIADRYGIPFASAISQSIRDQFALIGAIS
jgi:hypothetical protein